MCGSVVGEEDTPGAPSILSRIDFAEKAIDNPTSVESISVKENVADAYDYEPTCEVQDALETVLEAVEIFEPIPGGKISCRKQSGDVSGPPNIEDMVKWNMTFKDPELEAIYFNDHWSNFSWASVLRCSIMLLMVLAIVIPIQIAVDNSIFLSSLLLYTQQIFIAAIIATTQVFLPSFRVSNSMVGQNLVLGGFLLPLFIMWSLAAAWPETGDGFWHGCSHGDDILCKANDEERIPLEIFADVLVGMIMCIIYTRICWLLIAAACILLLTLFAATIGFGSGSGIHLLMACMLFYIIFARDKEISHRQDFIARKQLVSQANLIAKYSEALKHQGPSSAECSSHDFGQGMGTGEMVERELGDLISPEFLTSVFDGPTQNCTGMPTTNPRSSYAQTIGWEDHQAKPSGRGLKRVKLENPDQEERVKLENPDQSEPPLPLPLDLHSEEFQMAKMLASLPVEMQEAMIQKILTLQQHTRPTDMQTEGVPVQNYLGAAYSDQNVDQRNFQTMRYSPDSVEVDTSSASARLPSSYNTDSQVKKLCSSLGHYCEPMIPSVCHDILLLTEADSGAIVAANSRLTQFLDRLGEGMISEGQNILQQHLLDHLDDLDRMNLTCVEYTAEFPLEGISPVSIAVRIMRTQDDRLLLWGILDTSALSLNNQEVAKSSSCDPSSASAAAASPDNNVKLTWTDFDPGALTAQKTE